MAVNAECALWPEIPPELKGVDAALTAELNDMFVLKRNPFSERERQIIDLAMIDDKTAEQSARALFIGDKTMDNHRSNIIRRIGIVVGESMQGAVSLLCHSGFVAYGPDTSPLSGEEMTPRQALFLKGTALGLLGDSLSERIGFEPDSRQDKKPLKTRLGSLGLPRLVFRSYQCGLFVPAKALEVPSMADLGEAQPGPV